MITRMMPIDNAAPVAIPSNLDMRVWDNWTNLHAAFLTRGTDSDSKRAYHKVYNITYPYKREENTA